MFPRQFLSYLLAVRPVELRDAFYFKIGTHQISGRFYPWINLIFGSHRNAMYYFSRCVNPNQYAASYSISRGSILLSKNFLPLAP